MPWVKLDDQFPEHPKVVEAGPAAAWLYVCGLAYCARQLTDGTIPAAQVPRLTGSRTAVTLAERLVEVGLWERAPGGFRVHDYLEYNPTRAETLERRADVSAIRAAAGRAGGTRSGESRRSKREAKTKQFASENEANAKQKRSPVPSPVDLRSSVDPLHTDINPVPSVQREQVAPVPKVPVVAQAKHAALYGALTERFGVPANDAERSKYGRAAKLLVQAEATAGEVFELADALEQRWPDAECTPLALANNVSTLRQPKQNGRRIEPGTFDAIREEFADVAPRQALR